MEREAPGMTRLLHQLPDVSEQLGVGKSTVYALIAEGQLMAVKIGRRTLVPHEELERYVRGLKESAGERTDPTAVVSGDVA